MKIKYSTLAAYAVLATSAIIAAWKGSLDWMGLAILAVDFKMPGTQWLREAISGKVRAMTGKDRA